MTYKEVTKDIYVGLIIKRQSWDSLRVQYMDLFDGFDSFVDFAMVSYDALTNEYIGIYTPEPRDEFANDWVVIK